MTIKKKATIKSRTLFHHLKEITSNQSPDYFDTLSESDKKTWSTFMIVKFLSMNENWTPIINEIQKIAHTLEPSVLYKLLINVIPKSNVFLKYIKAADDAKFESWVVELFAKHFQTSNAKSVDYLKILYASDEGRDVIQDVCESYGVEPTKIKKLKL